MNDANGAFKVAKQKIQMLIERGLFHIFGANVINKVVGFSTNILIARFLSQEGYGVFSYAWSTYSIAVLFSGFGLVSGMLQYATEHRSKEEKSSYLKYGLIHGLTVDVIISLVIMVIGILIPLPISEAKKYLVLLAPLILLDYFFQYAQVVFRSRKENQRFALLTNVNSICFFAFGSIGAFLGGITGTILGRYLAYISNTVFSLISFKNIGYSVRRGSKLSKEEAKGFWHYSISTGASSVMNQLTYLLDVLIVGNVIANATVLADYRVATMLPEGLLFIPSAIIVFVGPYFIEHNDDMEWFSDNMRRVYLALEAMMLPIVIVLVLFAKQIILALWGPSYLGALVPFRIMSFSLALSPLRTVCANLLAALREVKANFIVSVISLITNVVLTTLLTLRFGSVGAAVGVMVVTGVASISSAIFLSIIVRRRYEIQTKIVNG